MILYHTIKVRVRKGLYNLPDYGNLGITPDMVDFEGKMIEVVKAEKERLDTERYYDGCGYRWNKEWLIFGGFANEEEI
jgi:hypothetical protein